MSERRAEEALRDVIARTGLDLSLESFKDEGSPHRTYSAVLYPRGAHPTDGGQILFQAEGIQNFRKSCMAFATGYETARRGK